MCFSISGKVTISVLKTNPDNIVKKILNKTKKLAKNDSQASIISGLWLNMYSRL